MRQETDVIPDFDSVEVDEGWHGERSMYVKRLADWGCAHFHPYHPVRYPSCRASGRNDRRLVHGSGIRAGDGECGYGKARTIEYATVARDHTVREGPHFALLEGGIVRVREHRTRFGEWTNQILLCRLEFLFDVILVSHESDVGVTPVV